MAGGEHQDRSGGNAGRISENRLESQPFPLLDTLAMQDQSLVQEVVEDCGFRNSDEFADYVRALTNRDVELEVTDAEIQKWTDAFMDTQVWRLESNPEELTRDDIYTIYRCALAKYIKEDK